MTATGEALPNPGVSSSPHSLEDPLLSDNMYGSIQKQQPGTNRPASGKRGSRMQTRRPTVLKQVFKSQHKLGSHGTGGVESSSSSRRTPHSFVYTLLNPRSRQWQATLFKTVITTVIVVDMIFFILSTEPKYQSRQDIFEVEEGIVSWIFLVEYLARLATIMESRHYKPFGPILGRLQYMVTWSALIDGLATFPYFVERFTDLKLPTLTYLRVFRLLRILKTQSYGDAMDAVVRVIYYNKEILYVALLLCLFLVLFTGVLMYYLRPPVDPNGTFESISSTTYIATLMLTGQGGPSEDLPWYTQMVVLMTSFFSLAMFAIPASMLTWGFEAEAERVAAAARRKRLAARASGTSNYVNSSTSSEWSSSGEDTSDEEYQKIIAGGEEEDEDERIERFLQLFQNADADKSGTLTQDEFMSKVANNPDLLAAGGVGVGRAGSRLVGVSGGVSKARLDRLENRVEEMNAKMDQILQLLSSGR